MSDTRRAIRKIASEADLWAALSAVLEHKGDDQPFRLDFSASDWAAVRIVYNGDRFDSSLTPSAMRGLVQLQSSLYRSAAIILRDKASARHLTAFQRAQLELTFKVGKGSADTEGLGKEFLSNLAGAISTMDSKHKLIAFIVLGITFFGVAPIAKEYIEYVDHTEAEEVHHQELKELEQHDEKLLDRAVKESKQAGAVRDQASEGYGAVIHNAGPVTSMTVQGVKLSRDSLDELQSSTRRTSRDVTFDGNYKITNVNPSSPDGYEIEVQSVKTKEKFKATLVDSLSSESMKRAIRQGEWSKKPVRLEIVARRLGDSIIEARIMRAKLPKSSPLLIRSDVIKV